MNQAKSPLKFGVSTVSASPDRQRTRALTESQALRLRPISGSEKEKRRQVGIIAHAKLVESFHEPIGNQMFANSKVPREKLEVPTTRFSVRPPPKETAVLVSGEQGTVYYSPEKERFQTTNQFYDYEVNPLESEKIRKQKQQELKLEKRREHEKRILETVKAEEAARQQAMERVLAMKKEQQQNYRKALEKRKELETRTKPNGIVF